MPLSPLSSASALSTASPVQETGANSLDLKGFIMPKPTLSKPPNFIVMVTNLSI